MGDRRGFAARVLCVLCASVAVSAFAQDEVEVVASRSGFRPATVKARKGETLRLRLKTADGEHCFALDAFRVEKRIVPGRTTPVELTPDRAGTFAFYCCLETGRAAEVERGRLEVAE